MRFALFAAATFLALSISPSANAQAHDPRSPFWVVGQLRFASQQGTITFGAIPCPAGEAFHLNQIHVIPTHTKLAADLGWTVTLPVIGGLGWKFANKGDDRAAFAFPAPMPFATGSTLAQKVSVTFDTPVSTTWRYFTVALLGVCKALPPTVTTTLS